MERGEFILVLIILSLMVLAMIMEKEYQLDQLKDTGTTVCKVGVLFNVDRNGTQQQIIGLNRAPIPCQ